MKTTSQKTRILRESIDDKKLLVIELAKVCTSKQEFIEIAIKEFQHDEDFNEIFDTIKKTASNIYDKYAPQEVKDFVSKATPAFKKGFDDYSDPNNLESMEKGVQQFGANLQQGLQNAQQIFNTVGKPLGLSTKDLPFILSVVVAGSTGGLGAIPYAVVQYFVRKQIYGTAGKIYDKVVGTQQPQNPAMEQIMSNKYLRTIWEANEYREKLRQKTAERFGSVAGKITGAAKLVSDALKKYIPQLTKLANDNKVAIGKTVFLYSLGVLMGMGAAKINDLMTQKPQEDALEGMKLAGFSEQEINNIKQHLKLVDKISQPGYEPSQQDMEQLDNLNRNASLSSIAHNDFENDENMKLAAYFAKQGDLEKAQFFQQKAADANLQSFVKGNIPQGPISYSGPNINPDKASEYMKNLPTSDQLNASLVKSPIDQTMALRSQEFKDIFNKLSDQDIKNRSLDSILGQFRTNQDVINDIDKIVPNTAQTSNMSPEEISKFLANQNR